MITIFPHDADFVARPDNCYVLTPAVGINVSEMLFRMPRLQTVSLYRSLLLVPRNANSQTGKASYRFTTHDPTKTGIHTFAIPLTYPDETDTIGSRDSILKLCPTPMGTVSHDATQIGARPVEITDLIGIVFQDELNQISLSLLIGKGNLSSETLEKYKWLSDHVIDSARLLAESMIPYSPN